MIMFGGLAEGGGNYYNDTWVYNITNNTWLNITPQGKYPQGRYGHSMVYDIKNNVVEFNKGAEDILGYKQSETVGRPLSEFLANPDHSNSLLEKVKQEGKISNHETQLITKQKKIIDLINPLRQGLLREKTILKMSGFKKIELKNIKRYGFQNVDSEFAPHLTFTKLSPPNKTALKKIKKTDFSFMVGQLALLRLGNHGTGRKLIATFDLKV